MAYRFLLMTKDKIWEKTLRRCLSGQPGVCEATDSPAEGWDRVVESRVDLLVLDIEMPALERLGWLRMLRGSPEGRTLPVVLASREKSDVELAEAFELGADDYVLKSCEERELLARLRSVLRRRFERTALVEGVLAVGVVTLDMARHICLVRGREVGLNAREFELLEVLLRQVGRVLSRPYLLETIWGMSASASTRTVDVSVSRLRKALGPRAGTWIETVERYGYRFRDPARVSR
ncbi:MAG: hypothetical protein A2506_10870 [Elusimicrobia bacterium RIFOXYD12_FULL_66_9]|nr:MAG: hypothetical protein A2506_10870 [Elusimicrobia bacterium RIFOXYD12_FULL_66_9]